MKKIIICICLFVASFTFGAADSLKQIGPTVKIAGNPEEVRTCPIWSPDGNSLAFTGANYRGIYIINLKNNKIKKLTDEPSAGYGFEWSADSKSILSKVAKYTDNTRSDAIKVFDLKTSKGRRLTSYRNTMDGLPHWGDNDGKVYIFTKGKMENLNSGKNTYSKKKTTSSANIYFLTDDFIATGNIFTKTYNKLYPVANAKYLNMSVAPDGSKIAFEIMGGGIFSMNADGSGLVNLGKGSRPKWSPDSKYLVYMIAIDDGHDYTLSDLYTIKFDGTEKQRLTFTNDKLEMNPAWSPDGKKIAFEEYKEGTVCILEINK